MYLTSGLRHSLGLAASWLSAAMILVAAVVWHAELRVLAGNMLGLQELQRQIAELGNPSESGARAERGSTAGEADGGPASGTVELKADRAGHFETEARINGRPIQVMVDTGASIVALTWEDAMAAGLNVRDADFTGQVRTANGAARVAPVQLDQVSIGDITVRGVQGVVSKPGAMHTTLLGMSFLKRLSRAEMRKGTLVLEQ